MGDPRTDTEQIWHQSVVAAAEALARAENVRRRSWWRRRRVSPMDMIPAAREVVATLSVRGLLRGSSNG